MAELTRQSGNGKHVWRGIIIAILAVIVLAAFISRGHAARGPGEDKGGRPGFVALFNGEDLANWQGLVELPDRAKLSV